MKLFIIPSWYPTKLHPENGSFFRDWAILLNDSGIEIVVITHVVHSFKDVIYHGKMQGTEFQIDNKFPVYINESINKFPWIQILAFTSYKNHIIKLYNKAADEQGIPDLVLFHSSLWASTALSNKLIGSKIPYIIIEHLKEFLIPNGFTPFQTKLIEKTYHSCAKIVVTSSALEKAVNNKFPAHKEKLVIIPNPIDEDKFILNTRSNKQSFITIICIALFRPEKRVDLIIHAFSKLIKSGIQCKLKLIGDGPLMSDLKGQVDKLDIGNKVQFLGYLPSNRIVEELHKSDLFVLASDMETFGAVLIEAQACGLPVVATDCGGPSDIVSSDTGVRVKSGSVDDLTRGIKDVINKLDQFNPVKIRNRTIKYFGKKTYTEAIKRVVGIIIK